MHTNQSVVLINNNNCKVIGERLSYKSLIDDHRCCLVIYTCTLHNYQVVTVGRGWWVWLGILIRIQSQYGYLIDKVIH